jgi:hypothetical protein
MLAQLYSMSLWTMRAIARGDTWAWVEPDGGPQAGDTGVETGGPQVNLAPGTIDASLERLGKLLGNADKPPVSCYDIPPPDEGNQALLDKFTREIAEHPTTQTSEALDELIKPTDDKRRPT